MKTKRLIAFSITVALIILSATSVLAATASVSKDGRTLTYPGYGLSGPAFRSCEPWNDHNVNTVTITGIPDGASVTVTTAWANPYSGSPTYLPADSYSNVTGGTLVHSVRYPMDTTQWPVFDTATNERAIAVSVLVQITSGGTTTKLVSKQWWIKCQPPLAPFEGCTPGYWRQEHHFDSWVGYAPSQDFEAVFGVNASFDPDTLLDALWLGGGGENALARHAVAALLNAAHPDVNYQYTAAEIIAGVQNAYATGNFEPFKGDLDYANNAGCELN